LDFYKMLGGHTEDRIAATSKSEPQPLPNKATQYSITKALQAAKIIRGPVRKHAFENAYASLRLHAQKLGIDVGKLGTYFNADEYRRLAGEVEIAIGNKYGTHPTVEMAAAGQGKSAPITGTRIVATAVRNPATGKVASGKNKIHVQLYPEVGLDPAKMKVVEIGEASGYLNDKGEFVTQDQADQIAIKAKQIEPQQNLSGEMVREGLSKATPEPA
jgi:hypothetical protein